MTEPRIAWVTGGSRGIGRAAALRLAADGYDVAVGFHTDDNAADAVVAACKDQGVRSVAVGGDVSRADHVARMHAQIVDDLGPVDVLVAAHGIYTRSALDELDLALWHRHLDVNLTGAHLVSQAVLPGMRERRFGRIVYLGSILGRTGSTHGAHYAATKGGLVAYMRSVAQAVAPDGVTANLVAPSMIDTDMLAVDTREKRAWREQVVPMGRVGTADEVAAAIAYLASDGAAYVTGTELRVDGGFQMG